MREEARKAAIRVVSRAETARFGQYFLVGVASAKADAARTPLAIVRNVGFNTKDRGRGNSSIATTPIFFEDECFVPIG